MTDLEKLKKKILYKAKHRGSKELDLLIGRFVDSVMDTLEKDQLEQLERLLDEDDIYLYHYLKEGDYRGYA